MAAFLSIKVRQSAPASDNHPTLIIIKLSNYQHLAGTALHSAPRTAMPEKMLRSGRIRCARLDLCSKLIFRSVPIARRALLRPSDRLKWAASFKVNFEF